MTEEEFRAVLKIYDPEARLEVKSEVIWTAEVYFQKEGYGAQMLWSTSSDKGLALDDLSWKIYGPVEDSDADADTRK